MDVKDKIESIIKDVNLNSVRFAAEIGIQGSTLSHILNGRNKPSLDVLKSILKRYQNINPEWLIMDVGPMYRTISDSQKAKPTPVIESNSYQSDLFSQNLAPKNDVPILPIQEKIVESAQNSVMDQSSTTNFTQFQNSVPPIIETAPAKSVTKVIVYYSDNTFQEFDPK